MHKDEIAIDEDLVRNLLRQQFPDWSTLSLRPVPSIGTDNTLFRLGDDLVVRLPKIGWASAAPEKEGRWLPILQPHLNVAIPCPLAIGRPTPLYPFHWTICNWISGRTPDPGSHGSSRQLAREVAEFVGQLHSIGTDGGPCASRGKPLASRTEPFQRALAALADTTDVRMLAEFWEEALSLAAWTRAPVWIHGDLMPGNLIVDDGGLKGIIDFGAFGIGDPACDCLAAWYLFDQGTRAYFRSCLELDDQTWYRGRAWALSIAVIALPYYETSCPEIAGNSRRVMAEVLADL